MSYIIKTYDGNKPLYFYRMCRRVYQQDETPAFREDLADARIFVMKDDAYRMMATIAESHPEIHLELEKVQLEMEEIPEKSSLRDSDGYVSLENTVAAMLSDDPAERLWAEYEQLNTRRHKLKEYRKRIEQSADHVELEMLDEQIAHMHRYMIDLLTRCEFKKIDLTKVEKGIASA